MSNPGFDIRIQRVAEQARLVQSVLASSQRDDAGIDFVKLGAALEVAAGLSTVVDALDNRKAIKAIHQELLDAHADNLGTDGDPELLQLDAALEILIARLTTVADSGDADWADLGPDARGQVVNASDYADLIAELQHNHAQVIDRMEALEGQLKEVTEDRLKLNVNVFGLVDISKSLSTAKLKERLEQMVLSGARLSGNRLGSASEEVRLALDAFEAEIERHERALESEDALRGQAVSLVAQAKQVAGHVRSFIQQVFGSSVGGAQRQDPWPAGRVFRDIEEPWCPEMVVIPGGTFLMGSPRDEKGRDEDEGPQHEVTVPRFALGTCAVTFAEYDWFCEATGRRVPDDDGWGRADRPAIDVSWVDAQAYCRWLSRETGAEYRLPSEAEWEYACRAGTETPFWWGSEISSDDANYNGFYTYGTGSRGEYRQRTVPIRRFSPNPFGLWQMHGNVWEWVEDHWHGDYNDAPSDGSAWKEDGGRKFVVRGGSWDSSAISLRSVHRAADYSDVRDNQSGFRVARTIAD